MPYMYCNQQGCNETVKLPSKYCAKHQPLKVPDPLPVKEAADLTLKVDVDKVSKSMNTKKTTK